MTCVRASLSMASALDKAVATIALVVAGVMPRRRGKSTRAW
mgnify:CR=1 FL=1